MSDGRIIKGKKCVAPRGRPCLAVTIHQPAPAVFDAFNRLVLLNYGRIAYWGPGRAAPLNFFAAQGFPYQQAG